MIDAIVFRRFKALREAGLELGPMNLVIGPNGSGKTSLIQAILRLRDLSQGAVTTTPVSLARHGVGPEILFRLSGGGEQAELRLACRHETVCDLLQVSPSVADWPVVAARLARIRSYLLDHHAMARPARRTEESAPALVGNGANLAAVVHAWQTHQPAAAEAWRAEVLRVMPEYDDLRTVEADDGQMVVLQFRLVDEAGWVTAADLSQGTLYLLAILALATDPNPPPLLTIEEIDRGIHPRLLREVQDALYRLSYPADASRPACQVIATTHSAHLLDLYREQPEEVIIAQKMGARASFTRLSDIPELDTILADGNLGDLWFSGVLGGVPEGS